VSYQPPTIGSVPAAEDQLRASVWWVRVLGQLVPDREAMVQDADWAYRAHRDGRVVPVHQEVFCLDQADLDSSSAHKHTPRQRLPITGEALPVVDAPVFPPGPLKEACIKDLPGSS
jgi:hypothetical protein